jgi:hypothetical protein
MINHLKKYRYLICKTIYDSHKSYLRKSAIDQNHNAYYIFNINLLKKKMA